MNTATSAPPILLVDDHPMDLDLTGRAFRKKKFSTKIEMARYRRPASRIPVVRTSSREDRDLKAPCDLGVNADIEKPVSFTQFIEIVEHIELDGCVFNERPF
ncbi:hypothetical protein [Hydrogenophaga sp.]|uniref:hypothetical protein n=1 Tax=Hydrogenophaga sp. TaxID=1904254 RepID=UPI003F6BB4C5